MTATEQLQDRYAAAIMLTYGVPAVALSHGSGCVVWDVDGQSYLDLMAGIAVSALTDVLNCLVPADIDRKEPFFPEPDIPVSDCISSQA